VSADTEDYYSADTKAVAAAGTDSIADLDTKFVADTKASADTKQVVAAGTDLVADPETMVSDTSISSGLKHMDKLQTGDFLHKRRLVETPLLVVDRVVVVEGHKMNLESSDSPDEGDKVDKDLSLHYTQRSCSVRSKSSLHFELGIYLYPCQFYRVLKSY